MTIPNQLVLHPNWDKDTKARKSFRQLLNERRLKLLELRNKALFHRDEAQLIEIQCELDNIEYWMQ